MNARPFQYVISIFALLIAIAHMWLPNVTIDAITLALIVIAIVPWLGTLFKSLEFPGGWKIEYHDLKMVERRIDEAGLLTTTEEVNGETKYSFLLVAGEDPNLALAGLRIEIEKRLIKLAESKGIDSPKATIRALLRTLTQAEVLSSEEYSVLSEMLDLLNSAVHGKKVDHRAAEWAIDIGPRLLASLDERKTVKNQ